MDEAEMQGSHGKSLSRRRLLQTGTVALSAVAAGTAGCVSSLPPLGGQVEFGRVDAPGPIDEASYRRWVPTPDGFPNDSWSGDPVIVAPGAFAGETAVTRSSIARSLVLSRLDYLGRPFEEYDLAVSIQGTIALEGNFEQPAVESFLADTRYSPAGDHRGFALYDRPDGNRVVAVDDGRIVTGRGDGSREAVEYLIELAAGEHTPYHETDETFARFSDRIGLSPAIMYGFGLAHADDALHSAMSYRFDEDAIYYVEDARFPEARSVPESEIREHLREMQRNFEPALVEVQTNGPLVSVEIRADRSSLDDRTREVPHIMWGWEKDRSARTITLHHEAGDSFDAEHVEIRDDDGLADTQFADEYATVEPGDSLTVHVPEDIGRASINVVLDLGGGSSTTLLNVYLGDSP